MKLDWLDFDKVMDWTSTTGLKILIFLIVAWILERISASVISRIVKNAMNRDKYTSEREERLREKTIANLITSITKAAIAVIVIMVILSELKIDIGPLLAGAGVVGFAVGFGAQSMIRDFIAGIFIVLENQYRVGDVVQLNGVDGQVKKITTRITVLRDLDGNVHYIPNGSVSMTTNKTMEYAKINLKIGVAYDSDINKVRDVINQVGQTLAKDDKWGKYITEAPYFARLNDFGDSAIIIRIFGKTQPAKQWEVEGELRHQIKIAFDKHKIVIPFQQVVVHQAKKSKSS